MANICKRADGSWRARYRDSAGKEHARHFGRRVDAQAWIDSVTTAVQTGSYVDPASSRVKFGVWAHQWLSTKVNLKQTTYATYEYLLNKHVLPTWTEVRLIEITHEGVASWVAGLSAKGLSASSVRQTHRVFSLALELAVRDGRLPRNPATGVPIPRVKKPQHVYLTHEQVDGLAGAASGQDRLVVLFLAYTGVRFGEMAGLQVQYLDLMRRRAHIVEAVAEVRGRVIFDSPKNHQRRSVPIPRFLVDELATHVADKSPSDFVFTAPEGGVLRNRNWRGGSFDRAVRQVGMQGLTPHGLRHTAASLAISSGANVKVVQQMLGHASATMTLDLYGHLFHDQLDEVANAMNAARQTARDKKTHADQGGNAPVLELKMLRDAAPEPSRTQPAAAR